MTITERIAKLIDVKSLMTLALTGVFGYLAITQQVSAEQFLTIFTVIVGFYFGTQSQKKSEEPDTSTINEIAHSVSTIVSSVQPTLIGSAQPKTEEQEKTGHQVIPIIPGSFLEKGND